MSASSFGVSQLLSQQWELGMAIEKHKFSEPHFILQFLSSFWTLQ
jgi:hypothetical protein